jgi:hypothetical protein
VQPSFGLNEQSREDILEEAYFLMRNLRFSYESIRNMPVSYRSWFIKKIAKERKQSEQLDQYGLDNDTPISRGQ